jgi:hypothetical protein
MDWLRLKAKRLSLLALFALAIQFGLSFGHIHLDRAFAGIALSSQTNVSVPAGGNDQDTRNDVCLICATIAMTGSAIDAAPPVLLLPAPFVAIGAEVAVQTIHHDTRRPFFQSRAPPVV